jgi:hypothetical protein
MCAPGGLSMRMWSLAKFGGAGAPTDKSQLAMRFDGLSNRQTITQAAKSDQSMWRGSPIPQE